MQLKETDRVQLLHEFNNLEHGMSVCAACLASFTIKSRNIYMKMVLVIKIYCIRCGAGVLCLGFNLFCNRQLITRKETQIMETTANADKKPQQHVYPIYKIYNINNF